MSTNQGQTLALNLFQRLDLIINAQYKAFRKDSRHNSGTVVLAYSIAIYRDHGENVGNTIASHLLDSSS